MDKTHTNKRNSLIPKQNGVKSVYVWRHMYCSLPFFIIGWFLWFFSAPSGKQATTTSIHILSNTSFTVIQ